MRVLLHGASAPAGARPLRPRRRRGGARAARGLTVVELMFAIAILALFATMALSQYGSYTYRIQVQDATKDIRALAAKIDFYYVDAHRYPVALDAVGCTVGTCVDPWGNPYQYINHALVNGNGKVRRDRNLNPLNADYDLYSVGKDGQSKMPITQSVSQDDVIRAGTGSYYGLASKF